MIANSNQIAKAIWELSQDNYIKEKGDISDEIYKDFINRAQPCYQMLLTIFLDKRVFTAMMSFAQSLQPHLPSYEVASMSDWMTKPAPNGRDGRAILIDNYIKVTTHPRESVKYFINKLMYSIENFVLLYDYAWKSNFLEN